MATKKKQASGILKSQIKEKMILTGIRFYPAELKDARALADKYAGGNLSEYMRAAVKSWRPGPGDLA